VIGAEVDLVDPADHHILVFHRRLAGFQAFGALEADGDLGPACSQAVDDQ
jgi:hypothetical protein